jgi:hypothetical protein
MLQSTKEELETMNEELQSANEELQTMNEELRQRTEESAQINGLLESILASLRGGQSSSIRIYACSSGAARRKSCGVCGPRKFTASISQPRYWSARGAAESPD